MSAVSRRKFWPYDEVTVSRDGSRFVFSAPWLTVAVNVDDSQIERASAIAERLSSSRATADDLDEVSWLMAAVAKHPFFYFLPRGQGFGSDFHASFAGRESSSPKDLLRTLLPESSLNEAVESVSRNSLSAVWTWDADAVLEFSRTGGGHDPESVFSVARRYHLLNDIENNRTAELFDYVSGLPKESPEFVRGASLIVRQNHYITQQCERVLSAALPIAKGGDEEVREFIRAEAGHDRILEKAMKDMGVDPAGIPVLDCVTVLMELFDRIGKRNFLAFAMVVDIFERTSAGDEDPFATVLRAGGAEGAARFVDAHREINDQGEHENVALGFLREMKAVDPAYVVESLRLAELLTQVIHAVSADTLKALRTSGA